MPWPENKQIIGTSVPRLDGPAKVSGRAKYSYDVNLPGLLHARILRSPHARAKILSIDTDKAEKMPGVRAVHRIKDPADNGKNMAEYAGDEIVAVAAATENAANDALRAIRVEYEVLAHLATAEAARQAGGEAVRQGKKDERGDDVGEALKRSAVTHEGTYGCDVCTHVCLETHGLVAKWDGDRLTVWASTQAVHGTRNQLVNHFNTPNVTCITDYMGGGFGSKFGADVQGRVAAELAKKAGAPVKLMLDRAEEHVAGGNRPSGFARVKAGVDRAGKLVAFDATSWGTGGHSRGSGFPLPYIYSVANRRRQHTDLFTNAGDARAMRAPGHPQGCMVMESLMDDLCHRFDPQLDPVEFRIRNLPSSQLRPVWIKELRLGAARIGWRKKWHPRGETTAGPWKHGVGCAIGTWGGRAGGAQATCTIHSSGRVEVECGSQDLGTGTRTLVPLVAAEILGLEVADVDGHIGSSAYPPAGGSGGSTSCGGVSLAVGVACQRALADLLQKVAPHLEVAAENLEAEGGRIRAKGDAGKDLTWRQACVLIGQEPIRQSASRKDGDRSMSSSGVGGAQFADVSVDVETGRVRLNRVVAVADCGMVMNRMLCESQVLGGVIMGIGYGLYENRRMDQQSGQQINKNMENYLLPGASDIPDIDVVLLDSPERGTIGIGEPPTIPTAAAISNAVANAIGTRVPITPISPRRVLDALEGRA